MTDAERIQKLTEALFVFASMAPLYDADPVLGQPASPGDELLRGYITVDDLRKARRICSEYGDDNWMRAVSNPGPEVKP